MTNEKTRLSEMLKRPNIYTLTHLFGITQKQVAMWSDKHQAQVSQYRNDNPNRLPLWLHVTMQRIVEDALDTIENEDYDDADVREFIPALSKFAQALIRKHKGKGLKRDR